MESIEELKKKIAEYEKRMGIGEHDPTKEAYIVLVDILNQQTDYLREFKIKSKISSDDKAAIVEYKNAKDLWEGLPDRIKSVRDLKIELKMEGEEKKSTYVRASAKSIADGTAEI